MRAIELPNTCASYAQIVDLQQQLLRFAAALPHHPLHLSERCELGGLIQPFSPALVLLVAAAMTQKPQLFAHAPHSGPALRERQRCAHAWLMLRDTLQRLMDQAHDNYLLTQSAASRDAMDTLHAAYHQPPPGFPADPQQEPRRLLLVNAYLLVNDFFRAIKKKKDAHKAQKTPARKPQLKGDARQARIQRFRHTAQAAMTRACARMAPPPPSPPPPSSPPPPQESQNSLDLRAPLGYTAARSMEDERTLIAHLAEFLGRPLAAARPEDSLQVTAEDLEQGDVEARALFDQLPAAAVDPALEAALAQERYPELVGVATQFAEGLAQDPSLVPGLSPSTANPALWERLCALDRSAGRVIHAGQQLFQGGETGELTAAGAAAGLCERALARVRALGEDPAVPREVRFAIQSAFAEPMRIEAAEAAKAQGPPSKAAPPPLSDAEERRATIAAIEAFLATLKQDGRP